MKRTVKVAILAVAIILVGAVVTLVLLMPPTSKDRISIDAVSLEWEYSQFYHGYIIKRATITVTNNGDSSNYDAILRGQLGENTLGASVPILASGETKTFNPPLQVQTGLQSGSYTLTLRVENPMGTQTYGQRTMSIHVP